jgi:hypothetical protein
MEAEYGGPDGPPMVRVGQVAVAISKESTGSWLCQYVSKRSVGDGYFRMEFVPVSSGSFCQECLNHVEQTLGYNLVPYTSKGADLDHCNRCYQCHPLLLVQLPDGHPANAVRGSTATN